MNYKQIIILHKGEEYTATLPPQDFGISAQLSGSKKDWHVFNLKEDGTATLQGKTKALGKCHWRVEGGPDGEYGFGIKKPSSPLHTAENSLYWAGVYHRSIALRLKLHQMAEKESNNA